MIDPFLTIVGSAPNPCPVCGDPPCRHDDAWCAACRKGEERRRAERAKPRPKPSTPQAIVESIMWSVREHGTAALQEPATIARLRECDAAALAQIDERIVKLKDSTR